MKRQKRPEPTLKMNLARNQRSRASRLIAGGFALLLYAGAFSPLGLGVAALAGSFDRSHHLSIHGGAQGMQLVLQHGRNCTGYHHGVVARALTIFARPTSATNPDHVIQFSAPDSFSRKAHLATPSSTAFAQPDFALVETSRTPPREAFLSSVPTHPPPCASGQLLCLRSTLLLI